MDSTEIIENIRAEVERLKETAKLMKLPTYKSGWNSAMNAVLQLLSTLQEQPVCDGLDEEIDRLWENGLSDELSGPHNSFDVVAKLARHFAQWQRKEKPVCDGLEEAALRFLLHNGSIINNLHRENAINEYIKEAFKAGAEWGRRNVLQEIVDGKTHPVDGITAAWLDNTEE